MFAASEGMVITLGAPGESVQAHMPHARASMRREAQFRACVKGSTADGKEFTEETMLRDVALQGALLSLRHAPRLQSELEVIIEAPGTDGVQQMHLRGYVVRLEAGRAFIEETAERIDAGEGSLNTEGAIAKFLATEAGNLAADAAIQALGGYGYTHEYMVEKIKRDARITTIYEGTSEIMEMTISRDRWQLHLKTRGQHYHEQAQLLEALHAQNPAAGALWK